LIFAGLDQRTELDERLRSRWPQAPEATITAADRALAGRFELLGRQVSFGQPIDWHLEPVSGLRTPLVHWSLINYLDPGVAGDYKVTWELNRHQYLLLLGKAYRHTGDEKYAAGFVEHVTSWIDLNPPKLGINWASSLEVSFRAISWTWALHFFRNSPQLTPEVFDRILRSLYLHGRHVESYLSTYFSPNTHLTGEALGLVYLGIVFPELRGAERWRRKGLSIFVRELKRHVGPDGVYFERSSCYHRYTADFLIHLLLLVEDLDPSLRDRLSATLSLLLDHLVYIARPDGSSPLFGDDDGGRLLPLDSRPPNDFRTTLAAGAVLLKRSDYRFAAGPASEELLWLMGTEGLDRFEALRQEQPPVTSRSFRDGGYHVMRDGWDRDANYLLIDSGPPQTLNCGHAHAGALSVDVCVNGARFLVDPGTYTYTADPELRDYLRSTEAHNTVSVDNQSAAVPAGPFKWSHVGVARLIRWTSGERFDYFEGEHGGYARLASPALHRRSIFFVKGDYWVIWDRVIGAAAHDITLQFHFAPGVEVTVEPDGPWATTGDANGGVVGLKASVLARNGGFHCKNGPVSLWYGDLREARICQHVSRGEPGTTDLFTLLLPLRAGGAEPICRELDADEGHILEIRRASERHLIACGGVAGVGGEFVQTDGHWAWVRMTDGRAVELALLDGSHLSVERRELLRMRERVGFVERLLETVTV
jgi:hypothetical protein